MCNIWPARRDYGKSFASRVKSVAGTEVLGLITQAQTVLAEAQDCIKDFLFFKQYCEA